MKAWSETSMTMRERYQLAALSLVGLRQQRKDESLTSFMSRHAAQVIELNRLWVDLADRSASPSPEQVLAWL